MLVDDGGEKTGRLSVKKIGPKFVGVLSRFLHRLLHTAGGVFRVFMSCRTTQNALNFPSFSSFVGSRHG